MSSDMKDDDVLMSPGDVCTLLNLKQSTLRKYALLLHNAGYKFHVNEKGQRGYFNKDVIILKRFIDVKESRDMTLEQAARAVLSWVNKSDMSVRDTNEKTNEYRYIDDIKTLKETVQKQNDLLFQLMHKLDKQQKYIEQLNAERDKEMIKYGREAEKNEREIIRLTGAVDEKEEESKKKETDTEETEKKGFWVRLFGK